MRRRLCFLSLATMLTAAGALQAQPAIQHVALECIEPGTFAVVLSGIDPEREIQTAKVYFRSSLYPDFYYVEMRHEDDRFVAVLPQPSPDTPKVVYYVEAVDLLFNSSRSAEFDPIVGKCKKRPDGAYIPGDDPKIIVGAVTAGSSALPPGFSAAGIIGTVSAAGISSGLGGGIGAGTAIASAAAAAGVAGAVVVASQGTTSATSSVAAASPTFPSTTTSAGAGPSSTVTTTVTSGPVPTTTTSPVPGSTTIPPGSTTTVFGSTSTAAITTTVVGTTTAVSTTTTSVVSTTTTSAALPALNPECFTVQSLGGDCKAKVDATCVNAPVDRYDWILDVGGSWGTVNKPNAGPSFVYQWSDCSSTTNITFQLTVWRGGSSSVSTKTFLIAGGLRAERSSRPPTIRLRTQMGLPPSDGSARGDIFLNGTLLRTVDSAQPAEIVAELAQGVNRIEAVVVEGATAEGFFRFEFPRELPPDGVRVIEGNVVALDSRAVVFRLSGHAGERVGFELRLQP
jgi:hypothetical protein